MAACIRVGKLGTMLEFVKRYGYNVYSQNGEDGIIQEVLNRIPIVDRIAIEFGAVDGDYCSNTRNLSGWTRLLYDIEPHKTNVVKMEITPENVNDLPDCSLMSIDIDGNDYAVWKALKQKPDLVIIEINSSLDPMTEHFSLEKGASYITMLNLGISKGYFLLCHTGNMIFIRRDHLHLFPEIADPITEHEKYFNYSWIEPVKST